MFKNEKGIDQFSLEVSKLRDLKQQLLITYKSIGKINYVQPKVKKHLKFKRSIYASKNIKRRKFNKFNKSCKTRFYLEPKYFSFLLGKGSKEIKFAVR